MLFKACQALTLLGRGTETKMNLSSSETHLKLFGRAQQNQTMCLHQKLKPQFTMKMTRVCMKGSPFWRQFAETMNEKSHLDTRSNSSLLPQVLSS